MAGARYSIDEVIALIKHSNLANLVVEGTDDLTVLRNVESALKADIPDIDFWDVGDKNAVLEIWARRSEMHPARVRFLADSDLWLFNDARSLYPGVIFVDGYAIENNCLASPEIAALAAAVPQTGQFWRNALENLTVWFSAEVWYFQNNQPFVINRGLDGLLDSQNGFNLTLQATARIALTDEAQRREIEAIVSEDPLKYIIGKVLVLTFKSVLEESEGLVFAKKTLLAIGSKLANPKLALLRGEIVNSFALEPI